MFNNLKQNITIDKLQRAEEEIDIQEGNNYFISYPEFLKYFRNIQTITEHNLIIGINFTYGWMPTIFNFPSDKFEFKEAINILNSVKKGHITTKKELNVLKEIFNNSLVGTSKLLHFINPTKFAIWDSNVYYYLTEEKPHSYRLNNCESYIDFLKFCNHITSQPDFGKIHNSLIKKMGYEMTRYRTAELVMYCKGKQLRGLS